MYNFHSAFADNNTWQTFYGVQINIENLSHQHLSNILWYWEIIVKEPIHMRMYEQLNSRFGGLRLPYRPLISFTGEIETLFKMGYITDKLNSDIVVNGKWIGKLEYN